MTANAPAARSPRLYAELAGWFHLLTAPADYADEAAWIIALLRGSVEGPLETLLELGSGGGNVASHLKRDLRLTLTDLAPAMIELSRSINPDCEHLVGDMRTLRLGRTFDAVLIHDAVMYLASDGDLAAALRTAAIHLRPGGVVVVVPDSVRETFRPATRHGGHDAEDGRGLRYLEWAYDPDPSDDTTVTEFAILTRARDGSVAVHHDRHVLGSFDRATWLRQLAAAGLVGRTTVDDAGRDVFVGVRPG